MTHEASATRADRLKGFADLLKRRNRVIECVVEGQSMGETLAQGSRIRLKFSSSGPSRGQVIAALRDDAIVTHRVVRTFNSGKSRGYVLTRGDASLIPDLPVPLDQVIGPVTEVMKDGRWEPVGPQAESTAVERFVFTTVTGLVAASMAFDVRLAGLVSRGILACVRPLGAELPPSRSTIGLQPIGTPAEEAAPREPAGDPDQAVTRPPRGPAMDEDEE